MTMRDLTCLHINLHREEEVDFLLRSLPNLKELNGLIVERDAIFSEEESDSEVELLDTSTKPVEREAEKRHTHDGGSQLVTDFYSDVSDQKETDMPL